MSIAYPKVHAIDIFLQIIFHLFTKLRSKSLT